MMMAVEKDRAAVKAAMSIGVVADNKVVGASRAATAAARAAAALAAANTAERDKFCESPLRLRSPGGEVESSDSPLPSKRTKCQPIENVSRRYSAEGAQIVNREPSKSSQK